MNRAGIVLTAGIAMAGVGAYVVGSNLSLPSQFPDPNAIGAEVQAASSGLVATYVSYGADLPDPAFIRFTLVAGTTTRQATDLWCRVLGRIFERESGWLEAEFVDQSGQVVVPGDCDSN